MRGRHDAAVVLAVAQIEGMTQLMHGFLEETPAQQRKIRGKTIELLPQPVHGNHGARAAHLGFSENVFQDGDVKIDIGNR